MPKNMHNPKTTETKYHIPKPKIEDTFVRSLIGEDTKQLLMKMNNQKLTFSFRFFDRSHEFFNLGGTCIEWCFTLFDILSEVSKQTKNELLTINRNFYDTHLLDWGKTSTKFNFDDNILEQYDAYQFRLGKSKGRVHGFIIGNCFYIVWLDPSHNLYPDDKYGGIKTYQFNPSCHEKLLEKILDLENKNNDLKKDIDYLWDSINNMH